MSHSEYVEQETVYYNTEYRIAQEDDMYPVSIIKITIRKNQRTSLFEYEEARTNYLNAGNLSEEQKREMIRIKKATKQDETEPLIFKTALIYSDLYDSLKDVEKEELERRIVEMRKAYLESKGG